MSFFFLFFFIRSRVIDVFLLSLLLHQIKSD